MVIQSIGTRRQDGGREGRTSIDRWTGMYLLALGGHPEQFERLVVEITPWLVARLLKHEKVGQVVRHHQDREDVLQTTFLRAWEKQALFDPARGSVRSWLYTIACNTAVDLWRKKRRLPTLQLDEQGFGGGSPVGATQADPERSLRMEALREAIEEVVAGYGDPTVRKVLRLRLLEGWKYREISEQLNIPQGSLGGWVQQAHTQLRDLFSRAA